MATYSFSQISTYNTCPMKYRFEKIEGLKPEFEENLHLILGTVVHDTLEELYKKVGMFSLMSEDDVREYFNKNRKEKIAKLKQSQNVRYDDSEIDSFYHRGVVYLQEYYAKYQPFDKDKLFGTEQDINFELGEEIGFRGKIDRLDMRDNDMVINDYKTNTKIPPDEKDKIQQQINLYGFGVKQKYASKVKKVMGRVYYLHFDTCYEWEITDEIIRKVQEDYLAIAQEIEAKKKLLRKGNQNAFETKTGTHCEYCVFKAICPAWKHQYMSEDGLAQPVDDMDSVKQLIDRYKKVSDEIKALEAKKEFYKDFIIKYAQEHSVTKLFSDMNKLSLATKETYAIDEDEEAKVIEQLQKEGAYEGLLSFDKNKFTKALKEGRIDFTNYEDMVEHKETTYISRVSEKKEKEEE